MNIDQLKKKYQTYLAAQEKVQTLRSEWPKTKNLIIDTLTELQQTLSMPAKIKVEDKVTGMEIVYLTFGKSNSGIYENIGSAKKPMIKEGGHLFYAQTYNGRITVWKTQPYIKKLTNKITPQQLGSYNPTNITEDLISDHVANFIESLAEWEDQEFNSDSIGYKLN